MTIRTRYFVIASLLVLTVGVGTGLVGYYVGLPIITRHRAYADLQLVPRDAAVVAYADVHDVMRSGLRRRIRQAMPMQQNGQREFENETGINIETDIDRIVACFEAQRDSRIQKGGLVLARGRFDQVKIESLMRDHGAEVETYDGKRLITVGAAPLHAFALAFIEPGLVALGGTGLVRTAIDRKRGGASAVDNQDLMNLVNSLDEPNAWAVGRFDALRSTGSLPEAVIERLPAITWFSLSGHVDGGVRGVLRADTLDEDAAKNLRDVVRGFVALAKLQAGSTPQWQPMLQSLELGGSGKTVALSFSVPGEVFETIGAMIPRRDPPPAR